MQADAFVDVHEITDVAPDATLVGLADTLTVTGTVVNASASEGASSDRASR